MADEFPAQDAAQADSNPEHSALGVGGALNAVGALASLALIGGIGVWGYKLVMRDVSGVPVVRAVEGPMRLQPENPGGRPADHQGLAVNAVAAQGTAEAPAERLVLAPRPVDLLDEDKPMVSASAQVALTLPTSPEPAASALGAGTDAAVETDAAADQTPQDTMQTLVNQLIAEVVPPETAPSGPKIVPAALRRVELPVAVEEDVMSEAHENPLDTGRDEAEITLAVYSGPGFATSLRPQTRPADGVAPMRAAFSGPGVADLDVDPQDVPAGTRLAQLGAFESAEVAASEWDRLSSKFSDYLDDKQRVIQKASSGGRTFYRLRALGFDDLSDARRFCSALVAEKADCIPVVHR
ncbi:SPOR domain-containing protein [Sedimentitalea sp. JM2-8]|uniref:SPOR domain-containing protein n=1 Tax=Sedimentitalea xiamensis TaxID=3050037 RepID=A0ABT7FDH5_9RHOB|nr:SPOR domain-containing protein [Sedimentitalea xiamensis]MDK3073110.1 SPOR domain-containing protein [Sedimentitalea xiamensis]